jgi:hypothetical protein
VYEQKCPSLISVSLAPTSYLGGDFIWAHTDPVVAANAVAEAPPRKIRLLVVTPLFFMPFSLILLKDRPPIYSRPNEARL